MNHKTANRLARVGKALTYFGLGVALAGAALFFVACSDNSKWCEPRRNVEQRLPACNNDPNNNNGGGNNQGGEGPDPIDLGTASDFVILAKSGVSTVPSSEVKGDVGVSPIDQTAITGFSFVMDASNVFATSPQVTGQIFAADFAPPTPANLTTSVSDMETAYTTAAGLTAPAPVTELGAGDISGLPIEAGLYKWSTGVAINTDVTLKGGPNDVWVFQIAGNLTQAAATQVKLIGGAQAKNVFWQTFGVATIGTTAKFKGTILAQTSIDVATDGKVDGRLLAQTAVTLDQATVKLP